VLELELRHFPPHAQAAAAGAVGAKPLLDVAPTVRRQWRNGEASGSSKFISNSKQFILRALNEK
jgi:hypothetical protein